MTIASTGGTVTLGLYDTQSQLKTKADITYVDNKVGPLIGGHKGFATLALAQAAQGTLPSGSVIEVTNDTTTSNNGLYLWNGTTLTKSAYDPKNQAVSEAKSYADINKLDISKIVYEYVDGNKIGAKTPRHLNFGVTSGFLLSAANYYDSCVIPVDAGDVLFILNDKQIYAAGNGGAYAFFAEDPYLSRTQARIVDNRTSPITDPETSLSYIRVTVPAGANYLILNTRYNNAAGTISNVFNWAIHSGAFNSSYEQGTEVITYINDVKVPTTGEVEKLSTSKVDKQSLKYSYQDGNKIGSKSDRATNFGLNGSRVLSAFTSIDSVSVPVDEKVKLVVFNDKGTFSTTVQAVYAFFAEDPLINRTQSHIVPVSVAKTDAVSGIAYQEVIVPDGAKYLLLNTRFTSGGVTTKYNWAVHENFFSSSYTQGHEYISKIENSSTEKYPSLHDNTPLKSRKNLYVGNSIPTIRVDDNGAYRSPNYDDVLSPLIPVEFGKIYTISGLSTSKMGNGTVRVLGFNNLTIPGNAVKLLGTVRGDTKITVTIDDPSILYIAFPIIRNGFGTAAEADNLAIQVEVGDAATSYEPAYYTKSILKLSSRIDDASVSSNLNLVSQFTQMDVVRDPSLSALTPISKTVGPYGLNYKLAGLSSVDNASNNLYGQISFATKGKKSINVNLMKWVNGEKVVGALKCTAFKIPSGSLDNPDSFPYVDQYPKDLYVHPAIAYTETPIAGFKYWMISSVFPPTSDGGVLWEDEDLFVSNDAVNWQRVRSMYETDKSYTTTTLRLPPQKLVESGARENAFLPSPVVGAVFEVSVPATSGMPEVDRQTYTLSSRLPWKHDPYLIIDGGYVYVYHCFNVFFNERNDKKSHFFVCVRTNNGVDWDFVRADGSTLRITEETNKQVFTKGADGKYNYLSYAYDNSRSNPEVVKFGEGDYELFWGTNFSTKYIGTTPYSFNFENPITVQTKAAGNHPTIVNDSGTLYLLTNTGVYRSENRGVSWSDLPHYPMWLGGISGMSYKKASCFGEDGKFILLDVQRCTAPAYSLSTFNYINDINNLFIYEYTSFTDFLDKATNGLVDAYIDLQVTKVNPVKGSREVIQMPYITPTQISGTGLEVTQRLSVGELTVESGDIVYLHVTLNSRKGAEIIFGGIDIS